MLLDSFIFSKENDKIMTTSLVIIFGLASSITWGAGDFSGGIASKKSNVYYVVLFAHAISLVLLFLSAIMLEPIPSVQTFLIGGLGGITGAIGLISLYKGLALGKMSIVAPIAAVITVIPPVLYSFFTDGIPELLQIIGIILAIVAIYFISYDRDDKEESTKLIFPIISGVSFGLFFIILSFAGTSVLWTLVAARSSSVILLGIITGIGLSGKFPSKNSFLIIATAGFFDTLGNIFFILASQQGRLDLASILSSFYPATTVILARIIQKELISTIQKVGVLISLLAIVTISM